MDKSIKNPIFVTGRDKGRRMGILFRMENSWFEVHIHTIDMVKVQQQNRVEVVDAIRGIAVAMILMLHSIEHFNLYNQTIPDAPWLRLVDQMVWDGLWFVVGGKAYAIFALLFGFSFYIMERNAARRGCDFRLRFCWRMLLLFGFGCLNAAFFCGEVLVLYSIVGLILPLVCRLKTRTLLIIAAVLMLQPVEWIKLAYAALVDGQATILEFDYYPYWQHAMQSLSEGTFLQTVATNLWDGQIFSLAWAWGAGRFFQTASLFILGLVAGRCGVFADTPENRRLWGRIFAVAWLAFMPLYGLSTLLPDFAGSLSPEEISGSAVGLFAAKGFMTPLMLIINSLHKFCFMAMTVTGLLFAFYCTRLSRPMQYIMPYGRMSLTNYITQSIIGSFLFYHWGLHLQLCDTWSVLLCSVVLVVQVLFCRWWMSCHSHGPLESLWKRLTWL